MMFDFSNLLMPLGVTRQSAVFTLKVYHAEDLPQSEWVSHKDLVLQE